jgi:hypothetical protein
VRVISSSGLPRRFSRRSTPFSPRHSTACVGVDAPYAQVDTFKYSDGSGAGAGKGFQYQAIVLENAKGETVTMGIGSPAGEFDEFAPEAQKVLDTLKWGDS